MGTRILEGARTRMRKIVEIQVKFDDATCVTIHRHDVDKLATIAELLRQLSDLKTQYEDLQQFFEAFGKGLG